MTTIFSAIQASPSMPPSITPAKPTAIPPSPGTWRHPNFSEIVSRQASSTFSDRDLHRALVNGAALVLSFAFGSNSHHAVNKLFTTLSISDPSTYTLVFLLVLRIFLLSNLVNALRPLSAYLNPKDEITDIPLTPTQRALLGLDPSVTSSPASPASEYITPPRYRRSSASFSSTSSLGSSSHGAATPDRRSISANYYSSSPLSASRTALGFSPSPYRTISRGSPFSSSPSPLLQKAIAMGSRGPREEEENKRRSTGLGRSQSLRDRGPRARADPSTPGPDRDVRGSRVPGVNYKWLYEKGGRLPRSESMQF